MDPLINDIDTSLAALLNRVSESTEFEFEYKNDLDEFGTSLASPERTLRHREWFLLERASDSIGGVPLETLHKAGHAAEDLDEIQSAECYAAMRASRAGVFLIAECEPGEGILIQDLLGMGRYVVPDPLLSAVPEGGGHAVGDLIVGRIYPHDYLNAGDKTTWALSPAATSIRNKRLITALDRDIGAMRSRSRGPLHMSQLDLESMFFSEQIVAKPESVQKESKQEEPQHSADELEANLRQQFSADGITHEDLDEFVKLLRRTPMPKDQLAPGGNDPVGWIMDELAFESDIDLAEARSAIQALWSAFNSEAMSKVGTPAPQASDDLWGTTEEESDPGKEANSDQKAAALARFDKGREAGRDVDALFAELQKELGIVDEDEDDGTNQVPDFPGVLGALMQEFLWDGSRLGELSIEQYAAESRTLELFIQYGSFLGLAEELSREHVEIFLARWLWEAVPNGGGEYDFGQLCGSLASFCQWLEEHHGHRIWTESKELILAAEGDLARLQKLNQALIKGAAESGDESEDWRLYEYVGGPDSDSGLDRWHTDTKRTLEASAPATGEGASLRSGDLLLGRLEGKTLLGRRVYPASAAPHLNATS